MKQIILIEDRKEVLNLLESNLLNSFQNIEIIAKKSSSDALEIMEFLPDIPLVICRDFTFNDDTAKNIINFVEQKKYQTRIIVLGEAPTLPVHQKIVAISTPFQYSDIIHHASKIMNIPIVENRRDELSAHSPISINYFIDLELCCCDVFLRIRKKNEPDQYIKVIREEEPFSKEQIAKYAMQQVDFLYIYGHKRQDFINFISDKWVAKIKLLNHDNTTFQKKIEFFTVAHEIIAREINCHGFNSAAIQLTDVLTESIIKGLDSRNSSIPNTLQQIAHTKSHYMYQHGHMLLALSIQVLDTMGITDLESCTTLYFASLFKDISLIRNPLLSKITTFEELEAADIDKHDYNAIINHACESAFVLKEYKKIPQKSLEMIMRHHGHLTGNGFSNTNFGKFDILDRIFFINCEFVKEFLTFDQAPRRSNQKTTPITYRLRKKYFSPEISDAIDVLNKTLQKQKHVFLKA